MDTVGRDVFGGQVLVGIGRIGEQQVGDRIRGDAIDLLRHAPVTGAQSRLDMGHSDSTRAGRQTADDGGGHVTDDDDQIRLRVAEKCIELEHDIRHLWIDAVAAGIEKEIRRSQLQFLEEDVGELVVIVLAGVHHQCLEAIRMTAQFGGDRRDFGKIRPRPGNEENLQDRGSSSVREVLEK